MVTRKETDQEIAEATEMAVRAFNTSLDKVWTDDSPKTKEEVKKMVEESYPNRKGENTSVAECMVLPVMAFVSIKFLKKILES